MSMVAMSRPVRDSMAACDMGKSKWDGMVTRHGEKAALNAPQLRIRIETL